MKVITVPKVPASAYNQNRPASDLLRRQVEQLGYILAPAGTRDRLAAQASRVKTEGDAAAFIAKVTRRLHPEGTTPAAARNAAPPTPSIAVTPVRKKAPRKTARKPAAATTGTSKANAAKPSAAASRRKPTPARPRAGNKTRRARGTTR